jgi:hypothetical protein
MREFKIWAASRSMDAAAAYAARGRAYQGLSDARLAEKWAAAFRSTLRHPARSDLRELERDLSSEHKLRGRKVPHEAVAEDRELLIAQIMAAYERSRTALEGMALGAGAADCDLKGLRTN